MKRLFGLAAIVAAISLLVFTAACGKADTKETPAPVKKDAKPAKKEVNVELQKKAEEFLTKYQAEITDLNKKGALGYWTAANSGKKEDFQAFAAANLAMKQLHSDKDRYAKIAELLKSKDQLKPVTAREIEVAYLGFKGNQLPKEMLKDLVDKGTEIEQLFNNFRGKVDGKEFTDNQLTEKLKAETKTAERKKIWEGMKQVGDLVAPKLIELAKKRNESAKKLGYKNYWEMQILLQEHDPKQIMAIFSELEKVTDEPFKQMKTKMDQELAARFKIKPEEMMPWHYDNPFFQDAPPSAAVDLDDFYKHLTKEEVVAITTKFYADFGLDIKDIVERSDMYEREGKQQHAFCIDIDHSGDVRVLQNVSPSCRWMETTLHEMGHAVYSKYNDPALPFSLRDSAHTFTTEAVAMIFGALAKNPLWMTKYTGADAAKIKEKEAAILEQRRREQLIFARWTLVMLHFEKALYENPDQDLNKLWWDIVERFQMLKRPEGRNAADWASKIHFAMAPVYYHNYMLGELFAAQMRSVLLKIAKHQGPAHTLAYAGNKEFGTFFIEKIFKPGARYPWPVFVEKATGEPLTAKYFAAELK